MCGKFNPTSVSGSKFMAKLPEINLGNPRKLLSKFLKYLEFFGTTLEAETLETQSRALKTRIIT